MGLPHIDDGTVPDVFGGRESLWRMSQRWSR